MKATTKMLHNEWAKPLTQKEIENWIDHMFECRRAERHLTVAGCPASYLVRCPFEKPLAVVTFS